VLYYRAAQWPRRRVVRRISSGKCQHDHHHRRTRPHPRRQQAPRYGADIVADIGLLTKLLPEISKRFGLDHEQVQKLEPQLAQQALVMASSLGNTMIGRMVTKRIVVALLRRVGARVAVGSMAKFVPFAGSAVAATISFGAMKLVGNSHVEDCYKTALALLPADQRALVNAKG
jgi:hypothetical protein